MKIKKDILYFYFFKFKYGFEPVLASWQLEKLSLIFKREEMKISVNNNKLPSNDNWECVGNENYSGGRGEWGVFEPDDEFMRNIDNYTENRYLNVGLYPNFLWLYKEFLPALKESIIFQDHLLEFVREWKTEIILSRRDEAKTVIFIGVHCRRTDFADHYQEVSGASLVDHIFFDKAFDIYRERYNNENQQVAFLAVSDDNHWIKENLAKHSDVVFGSDFSGRLVDQQDLVGFDLCVLSTSEHTIFTYGTFGLWGSLLAGGDVIAAKGRNNRTLTEEDEIYLRSDMAGWLYIDTLDPANVTVLQVNQTLGVFTLCPDPH